MPRCGCASETCACVIAEGEGISVSGTGIPTNPYVISSDQEAADTGITIQYNNADVITDVHQLDFRGTAVTVTPGVDEAVVTVAASGGGAVTAPTGTIWLFAGEVLPSGWLACDGSMKQIATYPDLFAALGTKFGGDGTTTFGVPNMANRAPVGVSATKSLGATGGAETASIAVANLPPHSHSIAHNHLAKNTSDDGAHDHSLQVSSGVGNGPSTHQGTSDYSTTRGPVLNSGTHHHSFNVDPYTGNTSSTSGANANPVSIMQPWMGMIFMIKT